MSEPYPRDLVGYGEHPPHPHWPGDARLALSFVLNYEEGGEASRPARRCRLRGLSARGAGHGGRARASAASASNRSTSTAPAPASGGSAGCSRSAGSRLPSMRSAWRSSAIPPAARAMVEAGFEVASHGWRWIDYHDVPEAEEREHMQLRDRGDRAGDRRAPGRLVHRPDQPATPAAWSPRRAASSTIPTPTPTTCPIGRSWPASRS